MDKTRERMETDERISLKRRFRNSLPPIESFRYQPMPATPVSAFTIKTEEVDDTCQGDFPSYANFCTVREEKEGGFLAEPSSADIPKAAAVPMKKNQLHSSTFQLPSQDERSCHHVDLPGYCNRQEAQKNDAICSSQVSHTGAEGDVGQEKINANSHEPSQNPSLSTFPIKIKVEFFENDLVSPCRGGTHASGIESVEACNVKCESRNEINTDELDHIPLQKRRKMLLLSCTSSMRGATPASGIQSVEACNVKSESCNEINSDKLDHIPLQERRKMLLLSCNSSMRQSTDASKEIHAASLTEYSSKAPDLLESISSNHTNFHEAKNSGSSTSSQTVFTQFGSPVGWELPSASAINIAGSALPAFIIKKEVETVENDLESLCNNTLSNLSNIDNLMPLKSELGVSDEFYIDDIDHMSLQERKKLLISRNVLNMDTPRNLKCLRKTVPSAPKCRPTISKTAKPESNNCQRKRKRTVTDSVEKALEEDAPGLIQVLISKGVMIDEIRLYGNMANDGELDESFDGENFHDLEIVIAKLFSERSSLLKLAQLRCRKRLQPSYCLGCLISLVEQTRYLHLAKWPVEWGWCRDLQAFIFVFKRHNRIVLERPEYGYATYFFELVDSLPTHWQINRLVTAMKLTSCGRASLIENKPLMVGEDLTEGEAMVLEEYGWVPNSGLGTMLNYCERVFHDRKKEKDGSEWRSKIGKVLMDGYNGGTVVMTDLPKKLIGYPKIEPADEFAALTAN